MENFNLQNALAAYLEEIDTKDLLNKEQTEELIDHLLTETEHLQEEGMNEREAFTLAIKKFGPSELISREYEQAKPLFTLKKAVILSSLLVFFYVFLAGLFNAISTTTLIMAAKLEITGNWISVLDLILKFFLVVVSIGYLRSTLSKRSFLKSRTVWLIPLLGMCAPFFSELISSFYGPTGLPQSQHSLMGDFFTNSRTVLTFLLIGTLVLCYTMVFRLNFLKWRDRWLYPATSRILIGIMVSFFAFFAIYTSVHFISFFSLWLASQLTVAEPMVRFADIVLKISFFGMLTAVAVGRIRQQQFYSKKEQLLIPIFGFACPFVLDFIFNKILNYTGGNLKLFMQLNVNSMVVLGISIICILTITYLLIYQERKRLAKS